MTWQEVRKGRGKGGSGIGASLAAMQNSIAQLAASIGNTYTSQGKGAPLQKKGSGKGGGRGNGKGVTGSELDPKWPLSCILLRAAWQSLAERQPTPTVARPPNSSTPVRLDMDQPPREAMPTCDTTHFTQSSEDTPGARPLSGPGPILSRCPSQGRHRHEGRLSGRVG